MTRRKTVVTRERAAATLRKTVATVDIVLQDVPALDEPMWLKVAELFEEAAATARAMAVQGYAAIAAEHGVLSAALAEGRRAAAAKVPHGGLS